MQISAFNKHYKKKTKVEPLNINRNYEFLNKFINYLLIVIILIYRFLINFKKKVTLVYIITKNNKIDDRCRILYDLYKDHNSLFLRHEAYSYNIKFVKAKSIVDYELIINIVCSIFYIFLYFKKYKKKNKYSPLKKLHITSLIARNLIKFIFKFFEVKYLICIDDSRHTGEMRYVAGVMNIETYAVQHGQISERFLGLSKYKFNNYIIWGPYFKNQLMKLGYDNSTNYLYGLPDNLHEQLKNYNNNKKIRKINNNLIMVIQENNVEDDFYKKLINFLKIKNFDIVFRKKNPVYSKKSYPLFNLNKSELDLGVSSFPSSLSLLSPFVVLGAKSTALLESWLFEVPSIVIESPHSEPNFFPTDYTYLHSVPLKNLNLVLERVRNLQLHDINEVKLHIWGDTSKVDSISNVIKKEIQENDQ